MMTHQVVGDLSNAFSLISTIVFAVVVIKRMPDPNDHFLDPAWKQEGFCVTARDVPYWTSHDVCFYIDTLSAIIMGLLYVKMRNVPKLQQPNQIFLASLIGVAAHGLGHGSAAAMIRRKQVDMMSSRETNVYNMIYDNSTTSWKQNHSLTTGTETLLFSQVAQLVMFWPFLLKAALNEQAWTTLMTIALPVIAIHFFLVPELFGFTFVQSVLVICFTFKELFGKPIDQKKSLSYSLQSALAAPVTLLGWLESTKCTAFVRDDLYGHVAYDAYIALSLLVWYLTCCYQAKNIKDRAYTKSKMF